MLSMEGQGNRVEPFKPIGNAYLGSSRRYAFCGQESIFEGAGRTTGGSDTTHTCGKLLDMNVLRCTALRCKHRATNYTELYYTAPTLHCGTLHSIALQSKHDHKES